jgi:hypothetical protein
MNGYDYYAFKDGTAYNIRMENNHNTRCDAEVNIDNEHVGTWRIEPNSTINVDRPVNIDKKFTFVEENGELFNRAGARQKNENGLIKIVFKPEQKTYSMEVTNSYGSGEFLGRARAKQTNGNFDSEEYKPLDLLSTNTKGFGSNYKQGATILGEQSNQRFVNANEIRRYDNENITTINARLVIDDARSHNSDFISLERGLRQQTNIQQPPPPIFRMAESWHEFAPPSVY